MWASATCCPPPRYEEGRFRAPRIHTGRGRGYRAVGLRDVLLGGGADIAGVPNDPFDYTIEPDLTIRLEVMGWLIARTKDINVDLLVEIDRTQKPARNLRKFARYDQFLTGWGLLHPRVEQLGTRPIAIFTSPNEPSMIALMKAADEVMTGRIGFTGDPDHAWYYPAATTSSSPPSPRSTAAPCAPGDSPNSPAHCATPSAAKASARRRP